MTCRQGSLSRYLSRLETALRVQVGGRWTISCAFCASVYRADEIGRFVTSEEINEWHVRMRGNQDIELLDQIL